MAPAGLAEQALHNDNVPYVQKQQLTAEWENDSKHNKFMHIWCKLWTSDADFIKISPF